MDRVDILYMYQNLYCSEEEQVQMLMVNVLKLGSWRTTSLSRSSPPRNFSRRFLDTAVWSAKEQVSGLLGLVCTGMYRVLLFSPYLHNGSDEHGQHGQGKSEDVKKRNGSESLLSSQYVAWAHPYKHCKWGQRNLRNKPCEKKRFAKPYLTCRFSSNGTHQSWSTAEDEGGDRR